MPSEIKNNIKSNTFAPSDKLETAGLIFLLHNNFSSQVKEPDLIQIEETTALKLNFKNQEGLDVTMEG